jgi:hypothetical protein
MVAAITYLIVRNVNGSAYGTMYFAPTNPVLQRNTKSAGAYFSSFSGT